MKFPKDYWGEIGVAIIFTIIIALFAIVIEFPELIPDVAIDPAQKVIFK